MGQLSGIQQAGQYDAREVQYRFIYVNVYVMSIIAAPKYIEPHFPLRLPVLPALRST